MNVEVDNLVLELEQFLNRQQYEEDTQQGTENRRRTKKSRKTALDFYGTDLTAQARQK